MQLLPSVAWSSEDDYHIKQHANLQSYRHADAYFSFTLTIIQTITYPLLFNLSTSESMCIYLQGPVINCNVRRLLYFDMLRDFMSLTFDLLTSKNYHTWRVNLRDLPPTQI